MNAFLVSTGRAENNPGAPANSDTNERNGDDPLAVIPKEEAHEFSSW